MGNPVLHQNTDFAEYEGMNWDRAADAVERNLQIDGGKRTNESAPVPMSSYGFAEPTALIADLIDQKLLPEEFLAKHDRPDGPPGWTTLSTLYAKHNQTEGIARVNVLCAAIPVSKIKLYKEDYRRYEEENPDMVHSPFDLLQSSAAGSDFEEEGPGVNRINKRFHCRTTGIAYILVEVIGLRSVHGAPQLEVPINRTHLKLERGVVRDCCDSLFIRAHADKFAEMQSRGMINDPRVHTIASLYPPEDKRYRKGLDEKYILRENQGTPDLLCCINGEAVSEAECMNEDDETEGMFMDQNGMILITGDIDTVLLNHADGHHQPGRDICPSAVQHVPSQPPSGNRCVSHSV